MGENKLQGRGLKRTSYRLNLTSLIDVLITLLLFFLLAAQFRLNEGVLPSTLPRIPTATDGAAAPGLEVLIRPAGAGNESAVYEIGGRHEALMDAEHLFDRLSRQGSADAHYLSSVPVVIRPRSDVRWEFVIEAFNQAARAKFQKISIQGQS